MKLRTKTTDCTYSHTSKHTCPHCGDRNGWRVHRTSIEKIVDKIVPMNSFQCYNCHRRFRIKIAF